MVVNHFLSGPVFRFSARFKIIKALSFSRLDTFSYRRFICFASKTRKIKMEYPVVKREDFVEEIHGVKIADPYRWLEDPDSEETKAFVEAQNAVSMPYLNSCPIKSEIHSRLTKMWNYPKFSCPYKRGSRYFFYKNTGLQNQSVLYVQDSLDGEPRVFLDPNTFSSDGTVAILASSFSEDGEIFAYGLSESGCEWISIHFKNVATGENYPEVLEKMKYSSITWTHDNKGIFYGRYPHQEGKSNDTTETTSVENQKLYYHRIGTPQSEDILVVEFPEHPKWRIGAKVTHCGEILLICPTKDCRDNLVYFSHLPKQITSKLELTCVIDVLEADYEYITNDGTVCIFRTNKGAPNYRLVKIDLMDPHPDKWETLLAEDKKNVLDWATVINQDKLVVCYMVDVKNVLEIRSLDKAEIICTLPLDIGTIAGFSGKRKHDEMFYQFTSFLSPGKIFHLDFNKPGYEPTLFREITIEGFDPSEFIMKQIFYPSKDGTQVPMFIFHHKDVPLDGSAPTLLYGYGGFNISLQPYFSISRILFVQMFQGIMAIPNTRGGGEYGDFWHNSGRLLNRQNAFNDFQAAAEYLQREKYTSREKLVIQGGSNGGLLVGACLNQRPDLFGAGISLVGVLDMLRFHKFTIGHCWVSDYGNPDEVEHFENVLKYSPLHNIKAPPQGVQYPATLLITGDHDDRVVPLHSLKFISELQHKIGPLPWQKNPLLIRIDTKSGHGRGKPTKKIIEEHVDAYCFIVKALGLKVMTNQP